MIAPSLKRTEHAHIRKAVEQGLGESGFQSSIATRQPLLQNAAWTKVLKRFLVKLGGIEEARAGCGYRGRGIDDDRVERFSRALEVSPRVVDHHVRMRGPQ